MEIKINMTAIIDQCNKTSVLEVIKHIHGMDEKMYLGKHWHRDPHRVFTPPDAFDILIKEMVKKGASFDVTTDILCVANLEAILSVQLHQNEFKKLPNDRNTSHLYFVTPDAVRANTAILLFGIPKNNILLYKKSIEEHKNMEFDSILENPPFQLPGKPTGNKSNNLWPKFLKGSLNLLKPNGFLGIISPSSWASLGTNSNEPGSVIFKDNFKPNTVHYIDFTFGKFFKSIGSTFSGYVIQKSDPKDTKKKLKVLTDIITQTTSTQMYMDDWVCFSTNYPNTEYMDIISHWIDPMTPSYKWIQDDPYHTGRQAMPDKIHAGDYGPSRTNELTERVYHTNPQSVLYTKPKFTNSFHNTWKIVTSYSGDFKTEVIDKCSLTDASLCVLGKSEFEMKSIQSVLEDPWIKFLITKVFLWSGYYSALVIKNVKALPTNKIYSHADIMNLFTNSQQKQIHEDFTSYMNAKKSSKKT